MPRGRAPKLTPEIERTLIEKLSEGCFLHVAASASGIHRNTLRTWMESEKPRYKKFQTNVNQAIAKARANAENRVWRNHPAVYLKYGPGRPKTAEDGTLLEGWTEAATHGQAKPENVNILMSPDFARIHQLILEVIGDDQTKRQLLAEKLQAMNRQVISAD